MTNRAARVCWGVLAAVVVLSVLTEFGRSLAGANLLVPAEDPGTGTG